MKNTSYYDATLKYLEDNPHVQLKERVIDFTNYDQSAKSAIPINLIKIRTALGMSQSSFSNLLGISRTQYRKYESADEILRLDIAQRIPIKCGRPLFVLLRNSLYDEFLEAEVNPEGFDQIWFFGNSLTDGYFERYCKTLAAYLGNSSYQFSLPPSELDARHFQLAAQENMNSIYIAIGEGIRAVRNYFGYSQEQIAELMNIALATYHEYEKASQRPRFNFLMAARWTVSTGIHPFVPLSGTHFKRIRYMQNVRQEEIHRVIGKSSKEEIKSTTSLVEGFYRTIENNADALFFSFEDTFKKAS